MSDQPGGGADLARSDPEPRPRSPLRGRAFRATAIAGVAAGVAYGLMFRAIFSNSQADDLFAVVSVAFLVVAPFALGFLTVFTGELRGGPWPWSARILLPWAASLMTLLAALALAWEGLICIFLWLPLFIFEATLGALVAVLVGWALRWRRRARLGTALSIAALPLLVSAIEHRVEPPQEIRRVATAIEIEASPAEVWPEIARVRRFEPEELPRSLSHAMGFPLPVEATLSHEGVGGVRHASFEGGVVFTETVTVWEPGRRLAFTIDADPTSIPMRTLDQHVTVGGPYFDVLDGEYTIEPLAPGRVRLHLASHHRVSTRVNAYARWWTDFVLGDVQRTILVAVRRRAERGFYRVPASAPGAPARP